MYHVNKHYIIFLAPREKQKDKGEGIKKIPENVRNHERSTSTHIP